MIIHFSGSVDKPKTVKVISKSCLTNLLAK